MANKIRHPLHTILFIAVSATICGADGPEEMENFAISKGDWLEQFVDLSSGIPSHDTIGRVLSLLRPEEFQQAFLSWLSSLNRLRDASGNPIFVPIDGKTMRGSYTNADKSDMLHIVSAWATEQGLALGQVAVDSKSNEITAIPKLLKMLELEGTIVSIDAMDCQREIAASIIRGGGDYTLQVKKNQPKLLEAIEEAFALADQQPASQSRIKRRKLQEKSRGRLESRSHAIMPLPASLKHLVNKWTGLKSIGRVVREVNRKGKTTIETSYYICSFSAKVGDFIKSTRSHWGIENSLHWVMDVVFGEDKSRVRQKHLAENMSFLRRFVISLLKQDTSRRSLKQKRKSAGWNTDFLEKLLFQQ